MLQRKVLLISTCEHTHTSKVYRHVNGMVRQALQLIWFAGHINTFTMWRQRGTPCGKRSRSCVLGMLACLQHASQANTCSISCCQTESNLVCYCPRHICAHPSARLLRLVRGPSLAHQCAHKIMLAMIQHTPPTLFTTLSAAWSVLQPRTATVYIQRLLFLWPTGVAFSCLSVCASDWLLPTEKQAHVIWTAFSKHIACRSVFSEENRSWWAESTGWFLMQA